MTSVCNIIQIMFAADNTQGKFMKSIPRRPLFTILVLTLLHTGIVFAQRTEPERDVKSSSLDYETTQKEDKQLLDSSVMQLGDLAADLKLTPLNRSSPKSSVQLSTLYAKKPVVVLMGSCTCNLTRDAVPKLNKLYDEFKDRANFAFVYIKEAHPTPNVSVAVAGKKVRLAQPETMSHRLKLARHLFDNTGLTVPIYVDDMQGTARKAYSSFHLAAYIINTDGDFVFMKPYRYDVDALGVALDKQLQAAAKNVSRSRKPTYANIAYGPHERNVVDFYKVESDEPTPLVVFFHGGGWRKGKKENLNFKLVGPSLENGVSVAAVNYRLTGHAPHPAQLHDSARAIQFLRTKATEWNIDPTRIAAFGGSAGGSISMWVALHDDMADPNSDDPIARQSSRLCCAFSYGGQSTNDPRVIRKIVPGNAYNEGALKPLFGLPADWDWDTGIVSDELSARLIDASPITHLSKDDPPLFLYHNQTFNVPGNIHHPNFGRYLKKQMDAVGVECTYQVDADRTKAFTDFTQKQFRKRQQDQ